MKKLLVNLRKISTQTWMWLTALVIGAGILSAWVGDRLKFPDTIMIPWICFVFFSMGVIFIGGAIRQEFFQYKVVRGPTAVVLNLLMVVFTWGLAIALLISWLTKR